MLVIKLLILSWIMYSKIISNLWGCSRIKWNLPSKITKKRGLLKNFSFWMNSSKWSMRCRWGITRKWRLFSKKYSSLSKMIDPIKKLMKLYWRQLKHCIENNRSRRITLRNWWKRQRLMKCENSKPILKCWKTKKNVYLNCSPKKLLRIKI